MVVDGEVDSIKKIFVLSPLVESQHLRPLSCLLR
jgi:hypothetical protein